MSLDLLATPFDEAQDAVVLLGCKCTLPGHVNVLVNQHP